MSPPVGPGAYNAFSAGSYWNKPFPANAPIDGSSATYIADALKMSGTHLQLTGAPGTSQAYAQPIYWGSVGDKEYTITDSGITVKVHIPAGATPASGNDGQIVIFDLPNNQVIGIHMAVHDAATDTWSTSGGLDRYMLDSNGLDNRVAGSDNPLNFGHRGIPASVRAVRVDEVKAGAINHRLECFWWATADQHYWPMAGHETGKGGVVPEGIVARIKPGVNLDGKGLNPAARVIAKSLQQYGCTVGDNSGGNSRVKLEANEAAWTSLGITTDSLAPISWSEWEFVAGGYGQP